MKWESSGRLKNIGQKVSCHETKVLWQDTFFVRVAKKLSAYEL